MGTSMNGPGRRAKFSPGFSRIGIAQATIANGTIYQPVELATHRRCVPESGTR